MSSEDVYMRLRNNTIHQIFIFPFVDFEGRLLILLKSIVSQISISDFIFISFIVFRSPPNDEDVRISNLLLTH